MRNGNPTDRRLSRVPYGRARKQIRDGDLLLYRARQKLSNRLIAKSSRSAYAHAAMAAWWGEVLMVLEMLQLCGGRAVTLSSQVKGWPGQWDLYRTNPGGRFQFDRSAAVATMLRLTGTPYGWGALLRAAVRRLPIVRLLARPPEDDAADGSPPHCSAAVARACRAGGVDPVPNLADWATDPADLGRSPFFQYKFTLTWE